MSLSLIHALSLSSVLVCTDWVVDTSSSKITYYIGLKTYLSRTAAGEEASGE